MSILSRFTRHEGGAVALLFGLTLVPLAGLTGVAVDYNRTSQVRVAAASAADAAAIEAVKVPGTLAERRASAARVFEANMKAFTSDTSYRVSYDPVMVNGVESAFRVSVTGDVSTMLTRIIGVQTIAFSVSAEAVNPKSAVTDVAFVLDTTDSMEGDRLTSLKSATTKLIEEFQRNQQTVGQTRVAVVPFAQYVNIGLSNRTQPWLSVPADYQEPTQNVCRMEREEIGRTNCRMVSVPPDPGERPFTCMRDGRPRTCGGRDPRPGYQTEQCDIVYGSNMVQRCEVTGGRWIRWHGCVGSRDAPLHTRDDSYQNRIPGLMDIACGSPVMELTSDLTGARNMINGLTTRGETYIPSGLIWGWRALSTQIPFAARASTPEAPTRKFLILVTDGQNTKSATFPTHDGNSTADANATTRTICENISRDEVTKLRLYTIAFEVTDPVVKDLLRSCSTMNGGEFYDAADAAQLSASLQTIGRSIWALRLSK